MSNKQLNTPVAIIIFNRPKCTRRVFEAIRQARPRHLFVIADGPRNDRKGDDSLCAETREAVETRIDWPCEVVKDYANKNLGCGTRLPSGLNNMFKQVDQAIILEDDVLPNNSFFSFSEAMLNKYVDEPRIMQISGYNRFNYSPCKSRNYFFSRYSDIWGWATWRRAWQYYDELDRVTWDGIIQSGKFASLCYSLREAEMLTYSLNKIFNKDLDAWGTRWDVAKTLINGLGIVPSFNLISNIGFGAGASHTVNPLNANRFVSVNKISPPYQGPDTLLSNSDFDIRYNRQMFSRRLTTEKLRSLFLKCLGKN